MQPESTQRSLQGALRSLPAGARVMLTAFLLIVGLGYLVAVANIIYSHDMADGKPGMSVDDIRAVYSGMTISKRVSDEIPSRALTMLRGAMREYVEDDADFTILENWLKKGAPPDELDAGESRKTPRRALILNCLRCHAQSTNSDIAKEAPFGPDEMTVDYEMMKPLLTTVTSSSVDLIEAPPQYTLKRLILVSHQHMLAIPIFTLAVGLMFMTVRWPRRWNGLITALPMVVLILDFAGWWLSRVFEPFVVVIAAAGGVFGLAFGFQILAVVVELWRPHRRGVG